MAQIFETRDWLAKESKLPKPERYGLPWRPNELRKLVELFITGHSLAHIGQALERPGDGLLIKLYQMRYLSKTPDYQWQIESPWKNQVRYKATLMDNHGPFFQLLQGDALREYRPPKDYTVEAMRSTKGPTSAVDDAFPITVETTNQPMKEHTMTDTSITVNNTTPYEELSLVFGKKTSDMTDADYIAAIKKVEGQISDLKSIKTSSKKLVASVAKLESYLTAITKAYDAA
jgi:hypothetical protein